MLDHLEKLLELSIRGDFFSCFLPSTLALGQPFEQSLAASIFNSFADVALLASAVIDVERDGCGLEIGHSC